MRKQLDTHILVMSDTVKYKTVSLRNDLYARLEKMSTELSPVKLSIPQTIELLLKQEEASEDLKQGWGQ